MDLDDLQLSRREADGDHRPGDAHGRRRRRPIRQVHHVDQDGDRREGRGEDPDPI